MTSSQIANWDHARVIFQAVAGVVTILYSRGVIGVRRLAAGQYEVDLVEPLPLPPGGPYIGGAMASIAETNPAALSTVQVEFTPAGILSVHTHQVGAHVDLGVPLDIWVQRFPTTT